MSTNTKSVNLILTNEGLKKFKTVPTFKNLLHTNQLNTLNVGENYITVNHYIYSSLKRVSGYDKDNITILDLKK